MQAFRTDGIPLGCAWAKLWARSAQSDTAHRNEQSVDEKKAAVGWKLTKRQPAWPEACPEPI